MDNRFLIYDGFENEIEFCFKEIIQKFNFKTHRISNYGVDFENSRCVLDLSYETGIQLWLKIPKYNITQMISTLSKIKGDKIFEKYRIIVLKKNNSDTMQELSRFLVENFSEELKE